MVLNRLVLSLLLFIKTSRITCGLFYSRQALAFLPLSRLRSRFLTPPYNCAFYRGFLRIDMGAEIFGQGSQRFCNRPGLRVATARTVGRFGIENL